MAINIFKKEDQADGNFNSGEILEKKLLDFLKIMVFLNHIQIYFIGLMHGHQIKRVQ